MKKSLFFLTAAATGAITALIVCSAFVLVVYLYPNILVRAPETSVHADLDPAGALDPLVLSDADTIPDMVAKANPAVVSVVVTKEVPVYERYFEEWNPFGFWGNGFQVPRVRENGTEEQEIGGGSGFIVSAEGLIVTNRHVVSDRDADYSVVLTSGESYPVRVLARDPQLDIAVLKIDQLAPETKLAYLSFGDSDSLRLGEPVVAIGNALAEFRNSVSVGVVSGLARSIVASDGFGRSEALNDVIQTDAAINPGNSGGPLLNLRGEVVGVNVATSRGADNIGFALPAAVVKGVVASVEATGSIVRPFLGVRYSMLTDTLREQNAIPVAYGALVIRGARPEELAVMPGSPADRAGIRENDIIMAIDDEPLRERDLATVLRSKVVGQTISVRVWTAGEERTVSVTLTEAPQ
jgi:serine protease Do